MKKVSFDIIAHSATNNVRFRVGKRGQENTKKHGTKIIICSTVVAHAESVPTLNFVVGVSNHSSMDVKRFEIIFQRLETRRELERFPLNVGANGYRNQNFLRITTKLSALQVKQYSSQSVKESFWCLSRAISCGIMRLDSSGGDVLVCIRWL